MRGARPWFTALNIVGLLAVAACGFRPLYAPSGTTNASLGKVFVDVIPGRNGQLLRQALQERLDGTGGGDKTLLLDVSYLERSEGISIESDNVSTRNRIAGLANWVLKKPGFLGEKVTSGTARSLDGTNNFSGQFFYADLSSEAIDKRIGDALADQIVQQIAAYFRAHPKPA